MAERKTGREAKYQDVIVVGGGLAGLDYRGFSLKGM